MTKPALLTKEIHLKKPKLSPESVRSIVSFCIILLQNFILVSYLFAPGTLLRIMLVNTTFFSLLTAVLSVLPIGFSVIAVISGLLNGGFWYLSQYVNASRGRPLNFLDIYCVKDAAKVSGNYPLVWDSNILIHLLITLGVTVFAAAAIILLNRKKKKSLLKKSLISLIGAAALLLFFHHLLVWKVAVLPMGWDEPEYVRTKGLYFAMYSEYKTSKIKEPESYTQEAAREALQAYTDTKGDDAEKQPYNVIMIMNESFADYSLIGEMDCSEDPLKILHARSDNLKEGKMAVSIYGSSTCNTEFESITGDPLCIFPERTMPYVMASLQNVPNEAGYMKSLGFSTTALHGYLGEEYKRRRIYNSWFTNPFISAEMFTGKIKGDEDKYDLFDIGMNFDSLPTFGDELEYVNRFISDAECYRKIEEVMKKDNANGDPSFTFMVTIQNHANYTENVDYQTKNFLSSDADPKLLPKNNYLTLLSISDQAFSDFLDGLKDYDEKTVVIMFGDHQPFLDYSDYIAEYSATGNEYQQIADRYIVPYFLWANYDIEWDMPEIISPNYLLTAVKKNCGMPLTAFDQLKLDAMADYPALTWFYSVNADGEFAAPEEADSSEAVRKYKYASYYNLFDAEQ